MIKFEVIPYLGVNDGKVSFEIKNIYELLY